MRKEIECYECKGKGFKGNRKGTTGYTCEKCGGRGRLNIPEQDVVCIPDHQCHDLFICVSDKRRYLQEKLNKTKNKKKRSVLLRRMASQRSEDTRDSIEWSARKEGEIYIQPKRRRYLFEIPFFKYRICFEKIKATENIDV